MKLPSRNMPLPARGTLFLTAVFVATAFLGRSWAQEAEWGDNPFLTERRPTVPEFTPGVSSRLALSGILWDAKDPSAIVNRQVVRVGEEVQGWRVLEIRKDQVILSDGLTTQTLTVD